MSDTQNLCPCCSGKAYAQCCKLFHSGRLPIHALDLMRSRYSAYALNLPDYIVSTTHPASPQYMDNKFSWKRKISQFSKNSSFLKLEVLDFKERETLASVTFIAHISQEDQDATFTEKSYFEKMGEKWFYRSGELSSGHAPNLVTTGQLRLLPLAYYGEPILRKKADPIAHITNDLRELIKEMVETMNSCTNGVGLAAPQVHHSIRLFIIRTPIENEDGNREAGPIEVFINPKLSSPSIETWEASEGCLSIPTIRCMVERPKEITIHYTNLEGLLIERRVKGWEARCIMHEYDHIEGILTVDRIDSKERAKIEVSLQNLEKRLHDGLEL